MAVGEWDQRQLCSDGGCVGVIGADGTCKVCGRAAQNWGDERKRGLIEPVEDEVEDVEADELAADAEAQAEADAFDRNEADELDEDEDEGDGLDDLDDDDDEDEDDAAAEPGARSPAESATLTAAPADWGNRRLCPDGSCIGVLGADGHCKVCGRRASGTSPPTASGTADSGFAVSTTDDAVSTTDDAVQTVASTITTDEEPGPSDPSEEHPIPGVDDPASPSSEPPGKDRA